MVGRCELLLKVWVRVEVGGGVSEKCVWIGDGDMRVEV